MASEDPKNKQEDVGMDESKPGLIENQSGEHNDGVHHRDADDTGEDEFYGK